MAPRLGVITDVSLLLVLLAASSCAGRDFVVDGPDGWTDHLFEQLNVKDTLVFVNDKDADEVLLVSPTHFGACNTSQPFLRLDGRESRFVLNSQGYYYFISADAGHCRDGERLIVFTVENKDNHTHSPLPPPPPPPIPKSSSSSAPPPAPSKPGPSSSSAPPPPTPRALRPTPPSPPSAGNASSPSPAPLTAPVAGTNGNCEPTAPPTSSAVALRAGILACFAAALLLELVGQDIKLTRMISS